MRRPLYLAGAARAVELDGPALRISMNGQADGRIPLRLLSRVIVRGSVSWSTAALTACFGAGIPLIFLRPDGQALGLCLPSVQTEESLCRRLARLEEEPDNLAAFADWARAEERRAILAHALPPGNREAPDLRPQSYRQQVLRDLDPSTQRALALWQQLEGLLVAQLSELFLGAGLNTRFAAPAQRGRLDPFSAFLAAGRWELVPTLRRLSAHRARHPEAWREGDQRRRRLARHYEATAPAIAASFRRRLLRLELWCQERAP